ncbi:MAG: ferrous iron transport protein A [Firmicutes bacterium]|nr:ferrous iron transport protein A [Bacillota bacterium]
MGKLLMDLGVGEVGRIAELTTSDRKIVAILMRLGIIPGISIRLLRKKPACILQVGHSKVALDYDLAMFIRIYPRK